MKMDQKKIIVLPCSGIGKALGTLTRWTAFELVENFRPETTRLFCLARLVVPDEEAKEILATHQFIAIDGCPKNCGTKNCERNAGTILKSYSIAQYFRKNRDLKFNRKNVIDPGKNGEEFARRCAASIAEDLDNLLQNTPKEDQK